MNEKNTLHNTKGESGKFSKADKIRSIFEKGKRSKKYLKNAGNDNGDLLKIIRELEEQLEDMLISCKKIEDSILRIDQCGVYNICCSPNKEDWHACYRYYNNRE